MIVSLQSKEIDVAIGLTEGFIAFLANNGDAAGFKLVGTYVETPLCWAISTGADRDMNSVKDLRGKNMGCSRIGRSVITLFIPIIPNCWRPKAEL